MAAMSFPTVGIDSVRDIVDSLLPLVSWKTLALVLALVNIKNLPFTWHVGRPILFGSAALQNGYPSLLSTVAHFT